MFKKYYIFYFVILLLSSCATVRDIEDNIYHYKKLTMYSKIKMVDYSKYTNDIDGIRFLVANHPDQIIHLKGKDFDNRYQKLISYLKDNGYKVVINEKLPFTATIIAEVNKPLPNVKYVGVTMQQNSVKEDTVFNIFYGDSAFKARKFYNDYKKTL